MRSIGSRVGEREQRVGIGGVDGDEPRRRAAMPGLPGAQIRSAHVGIAREPPGERVLAAAAADDENSHACSALSRFDCK